MTDMHYLSRLSTFLLSFRRTTWTAADYPQRWRQQDTTSIHKGRAMLVPKLWVVQIPGWWTMSGTGDTREEALAELEGALRSYREANGALPRPGTTVPIQFAPSEQLAGFDDIAREFFPPILHMDFDDCLITDGSSIWDFPVEESEQEVANKVMIIFGVDISDIADGNLAAIFRRIQSHRRGV